MPICGLLCLENCLLNNAFKFPLEMRRVVYCFGVLFCLNLVLGDDYASLGNDSVLLGKVFVLSELLGNRGQFFVTK